MICAREEREVDCGICGCPTMTKSNSPTVFCLPCRIARKREVRSASASKRGPGHRAFNVQFGQTVPCLHCGTPVTTRNSNGKARCEACKVKDDQKRAQQQREKRIELAKTKRPCTTPGCQRTAIPTSVAGHCWSCKLADAKRRQAEFKPRSCCGVCYGLAHRRELGGCTGCGEAFEALTVRVRAEASPGCSLAYVA